MALALPVRAAVSLSLLDSAITKKHDMYSVLKALAPLQEIAILSTVKHMTESSLTPWSLYICRLQGGHLQ